MKEMIREMERKYGMEERNLDNIWLKRNNMKDERYKMEEIWYIEGMGKLKRREEMVM